MVRNLHTRPVGGMVKKCDQEDKEGVKTEHKVKCKQIEKMRERGQVSDSEY